MRKTAFDKFIMHKCKYPFKRVRAVPISIKSPEAEVVPFLFYILCSFFSLVLGGCGVGVSCEGNSICSTSGAPTITGASATTNSDGTQTVTITGTGFTIYDVVTVNGVSCTPVIIDSPSQLRCTLPGGTPIINIVVTDTAGGGSSGSQVLGIGVGATSACKVASGGAKCWGSNTFGELGNNSQTESHISVQVQGLTSGVTAISSGGGGQGCAIVSGSTKC